MNNFNFQNPVKILFGKGKVSELKENIPQGAKVMLVYGGGSIKKNGVYEEVVSALSGISMIEFGGIEPNPHFETAMKAVELAKKEQVDFLLAVGGGSVVDATKFIAAAIPFEGDDAWDILSKGAKVNAAIPLGVVLTLPATGSEMNANSVITKEATKEKLPFSSPLVMPVFSVLDPGHTYSLPQRQVVNGVVDAFVHVIEQYLTYDVDSPVQDRTAEGILVTLIEEGRKAVSYESPDYNNRANLVWAATMALNGIIGVGVKSDWATHTIGHELTAFHGLDHALTLAIVLPGLMSTVKGIRAERMVQYAERVWGITEGTHEERIAKGIEATDAFFRELGMKNRLHEHGISSETIDTIVERFDGRKMKNLGVQQDISLEDVRQILIMQIN